MSKQEKLVMRFKAKPTDFSWSKLIKLLDGFGYEMIARGKTSGSARKFYHEAHGFISLHEPHPTKILKSYQIKLVLEKLREDRLI